MKCPECDGTAKMQICEKCHYFEGRKTNEKWLRSVTFEELAGAIYEWYTLGYTRGKNGKKLNSITEVVEWLKEKHE